jgi:hypothetical protein
MTLSLMHPMFQVQSTSAITLHPILFGKSTLTYSCACQAEVVVSAKSKLHSRNCKSYWNFEVFARVPRLASNYVSICKLQALYFVTCWFWRGVNCERWKLCIAHFCEVPKHFNLILTTKWHLTCVEDFNIEHCVRSSSDKDNLNVDIDLNSHMNSTMTRKIATRTIWIWRLILDSYHVGVHLKPTYHVWRHSHATSVWLQGAIILFHFVQNELEWIRFYSTGSKKANATKSTSRCCQES